MLAVIKINPDASNFPTERDMLHTSAYGMFGHPVYSDIHLQVGDSKIVLLNVLCAVSLTNTVVKTAVTKKKGTVKESISAEDHHVKMTGSLTSEDPDKFPVDDLQHLVRIIEKGDRIDVYSELLSIFNVHHLVFDKHEFRQNTGSQGEIDFTLDFDEDEDIRLNVE